jgi:hypothetical protein
MGRLFRWLLAPITVGALFLLWFAFGLGYAVQENCEPDCVTEGQVTTAGWIFWVAAGAWAVFLIAYFWRRRNRDLLAITAFGYVSSLAFLALPDFGPQATGAAATLVGVAGALAAANSWGVARVTEPRD